MCGKYYKSKGAVTIYYSSSHMQSIKNIKNEKRFVVCIFIIYCNDQCPANMDLSLLHEILKKFIIGRNITTA